MEMRVQLKVCEGCGCLWYRGQGEPRVYCAGCDKRLREFPSAASRKRRGRPKKVVLATVLAVESAGLFDFEDAMVEEARFGLAACRGFDGHMVVLAEAGLLACGCTGFNSVSSVAGGAQ